MLPNGMHKVDKSDENDNDEDMFEGSGLTVGMIVQGVTHLAIDTLLVYLLWNNALVGAVDGVHGISIPAAFGIIFLARSISRG